MNLILLIYLSALASASVHPVNEEIISKIRQKATWIPVEINENKFAFWTVEDIKSMLGTKLETIEQENLPIPEGMSSNFDGRTRWGDKIHPIRDQGKCGSCWAFGATEALSDRFAIQAHTNVILSPQFLVSCDHSDYGCQGGSPSNAWKFMMDKGVVSDSCMPYTSGMNGNTDCITKCQDGKSLKYYHAFGYKKSASVSETMSAISFDGPVEAAFTVYEDFLNYKSGIYQHIEGSMLGGHAIKCIGYGTENGTDYWLMANSWGPDWGEEGYFRIKRGDSSVDGNFVFGNPGNVFLSSS